MSSRLHSAALIDKQQYEDTQRASTASRAFLSTPAPAPAPDPLTSGFLGSDLFGKLFRRQSQERPSSLHPQSRSQSSRSRRGSFSLSQDRRLVSLLDTEQVSSSRGRTRRYSLVSSLDTTQTREASSSSSYTERREKPPELGELNTLQQAIPVARAAARFRSAISEEVEEGEERSRRRRRKSHSLY